jgi:hypothetical protein
MSYTLAVEDQTGFLYVKVTGENSPETFESYLLAVYKACTERGFSSVLIEENLSGPSLDPVEVYRIVTIASALTSPVLRGIAYVDTNPEHPKAILDLGEAVARDRGVNIRVFTNTAEASRWLRDL